MQQLVLKIDESHYWLLLQFLKTLDYVKIVQPSTEAEVETEKPSGLEDSGSGNQLILLMQQLEKQKRPLFQQITDPVAWQKQQRDEWS